MKYTPEILKQAVLNSTSISSVIRFIGANVSGSMHRHIKHRILHFEIDISHFHYKVNRNRSNTYEKLHCDQILVKNRVGRREITSILRRALIESGVQECCGECGLSKIWNNKKIVLQIDHKNGDGLDNSKENLRFLCPNCHSQTSNYAIKNSKVYGTRKLKSKQHCLDKKPYIRKTNRPDKEVLKKLVFEKPCIQIAKDFGVSDKSVEKWCKLYGIEKPPRGYWAKKNANRV